ncbi:hypothetical protein ACLKA6_001287 [Drosophila palustris]
MKDGNARSRGVSGGSAAGGVACVMLDDAHKPQSSSQVSMQSPSCGGLPGQSFNPVPHGYPDLKVVASHVVSGVDFVVLQVTTLVDVLGVVIYVVLGVV